MKQFCKTWQFVLILIIMMDQSGLSLSKNILLLCPIAAKSHKSIFQSVASALTSQGHQVTLVSSYSRGGDPSDLDVGGRDKNVTEIVAGNFQKVVTQLVTTFVWQRPSVFSYINFDISQIHASCHQLYQNTQFMELLGQKFDLIFTEAILHDCLWGFVYKLGAPFVILTPQPPPSFITQFAGNRLPPSFVPNFMMQCVDEMNYFQRFFNTILNLAMETFLYLKLTKESTVIYRHYLGQDVPESDQIKENVAMIMINSHFITNYPRPTMTDVIEVGGMHCRPSKPLPQDLEDFVSTSGHHGFILFSLGSMLDGNQMPGEIRKLFLRVFSRLPQKIIWKWETGSMDDEAEELIPKNVKLVHWIPQQDILGHSKIKLFITHGGLLGLQEAVYHGVPFVGFPSFSDTHMNIQKGVQNGYALSLDLWTLTEEIFETTINRILQEKKFSERAKEFSKLFQDEQNGPLDRVIFWSEYLMRHKNLGHLKSAARKLNFFQYYSIDIALSLLLIVLGLGWLCNFVFCKVWKFFYDIFIWQQNANVEQKVVKSVNKH